MRAKGKLVFNEILRFWTTLGCTDTNYRPQTQKGADFGRRQAF